MPICIETQQQARAVRDLLFCYLCGKTLEPHQVRDKDHIPPKSIFRAADRTFPLILPVHERCNKRYSTIDEPIGQLLRRLHTPTESDQIVRSEVIATFPDQAIQIRRNLPIRPSIFRIVRACYAALYREWIPVNTRNKIISPIVECDVVTYSPHPDNDLPQNTTFCRHLKEAAFSGKADRIMTNNGKFEFISTFTSADDGTHLCLFGVNIYDWHNLAIPILGRPQGCFGFLAAPHGHVPEGASNRGVIQTVIRNKEPLNPFEQQGCQQSVRADVLTSPDGTADGN